MGCNPRATFIKQRRRQYQAPAELHQAADSSQGSMDARNLRVFTRPTKPPKSFVPRRPPPPPARPHGGLRHHVSGGKKRATNGAGNGFWRGSARDYGSAIPRLPKVVRLKSQEGEGGERAIQRDSRPDSISGREEMDSAEERRCPA